MYISGPQRQQLPKLWRLLIVVVLLTLISGFLFPATASAHVELRQASPDRGETVGGAIHSITLQVFDPELNKPWTLNTSDAATELH